MSSKHRKRCLVCTWFFTLLCTLMLALVLEPVPAPSGERPPLTLGAGPVSSPAPGTGLDRAPAPPSPTVPPAPLTIARRSKSAPVSPPATPAGERPSITLRAGPGEQYAIVATVPTASSIEFTIFDEHEEWSRVRVPSGEEGWMRLGARPGTSPAPGTGLDRAPAPASTPVQPTPPPAAPLPELQPEQAAPPLATTTPVRSPGPRSTSPAVPPAPPTANRPPELAPEKPAATLPSATTGLPTEQRTALVIGNAAYEREVGALQNAGNDAEDVASTLRQLGFQVMLVRDAEYGQMDEALRAFHEQLRQHRGVGLFYFAGHGAELDGLGYLLPLHSGIRDRWQLPHKAMTVKYIQAAMENAGSRLNMIILDACRDIPAFEASDMQSRGRGLTPQRGLPVTTAGPDMLIAYATSPGQTALDGADQGRNGLYTKHLIRAMAVPGVSAEDVFRETRRGVLEETSGRQRPWESVSLTERFEFMPSPRSR